MATDGCTLGWPTGHISPNAASLMVWGRFPNPPGRFKGLRTQRVMNSRLHRFLLSTTDLPEASVRILAVSTLSLTLQELVMIADCCRGRVNFRKFTALRPVFLSPFPAEIDRDRFGDWLSCALWM